MISKASALRRSNSLRLNGSKLLLALFARGSFLHLNLIAIGSMTRDIESAPNENETSTGSARQVLVDFLPTVEKQPTLSAGRSLSFSWAISLLRYRILVLRTARVLSRCWGTSVAQF
jgi:hypothetical protein